MKIQERHLTVNPYSRPGRKLESVKALVMHWVANPGTSAQANRDYFESRKDGNRSYGSAHYIVDIEGDILECIPPDEVAYHCGARSYTPYKEILTKGSPNNCTIGIELCHLDWEGLFSEATLLGAAELCAQLCREHDLDPLRDITTHNAITGKDCPRYWVNHPQGLGYFQRLVTTLQRG